MFIDFMSAILDFKMVDSSYTNTSNHMWFIDSKNILVDTKNMPGRVIVAELC